VVRDGQAKLQARNLTILMTACDRPCSGRSRPGLPAFGAKLLIGTITAAGYYRRAMLGLKGKRPMPYQVVIRSTRTPLCFLIRSAGRELTWQ